MDSLDSRRGGRGGSGERDRVGAGRRSSTSESSGWSLEKSKQEWKRIGEEDQSSQSSSGHWLYGRSRDGNPFNSIPKYKHDSDSSKLRSESMREELTRNYIKPPPNRVVHCCSFPCLCRPGDSNQLPQQQSSKHHQHRDGRSTDDDRDRRSGNWFKLSSASSSTAQDRGSKDHDRSS